MRLLFPGFIALWMLLQLGGCSPSPLAERWPEQRPLGRALESYRPSREPHGNREERAISRPKPGDPMSLPGALSLALMNNPQLEGFGWDVRAAEARALQVSLWPNPEMEVEIEGVGQNSDSLGLKETETTIRLSQPILTGGKLAKRTKVAELDRDLAAWDYEAQRLDVFTQVVQHYVDVLAAKRRVGVAEQTFGLAEQVLDTVARQVEAGEVSSIERRRATVELSEARIALQQARRALRSARAGLAGAIGLKEAGFGDVTGELKPAGPIPPLTLLVQQVEQNPAIARWTAELEQREAQVDLAKAEALPDVTLSAGLQRFNESDEYGGIVSVGVPLPIFDRNQGRILEARFDLAGARARQRAAEVLIHTQLTQAYEELLAVQAELATLEEEALPAARSAYADIRTTYRQGKRPLLDVLDAQRTLFSLEARQVDALAAYHRTAAQIERLTGQTLDGLAATEIETSVAPAPVLQPTQTKIEEPDYED